MLFAVQEQALRTNAIKAMIDKQAVSPKCRLCETKDETVVHLVKSGTKEDMTMLPEEYIGNCARSMELKAQTGDMSIHLLVS